MTYRFYKPINPLIHGLPPITNAQSRVNW